MGIQDFFNWRPQSATATSTTAAADEELPADVDEPPDNRSSTEHSQTDFHKTTVRAKMIRKESLLTRALMKTPETETFQPEIRVATDLTRRRSMVSNASMASTAELTSDGGLTSPARTNTPSPPPPGAFYASFAPYTLGSKPNPAPTSAANLKPKETVVFPDIVSVSPKAVEAVAPPKKRCITFACGAAKAPKPVVEIVAPQPAIATTEPPKRTCRIKFACPGPKPSEKAATEKAATTNQPESTKVKPAETSKKSTSRSPSIPRKSPRAALQAPPRPQRDSVTSSRRGSQSPTAVRVKPKCIITNPTLESSEATRFHEFASEDPQDDDWIREEPEASKKLTINDTLKKENAIRQLGNEAEEEALEEDDEEEDDQDVNYSEDDDEDDESDDGDDDVSDGNETDNEAGFGESDEDSDAEGEFDFWTVGRNLSNPEIAEASTYRASAHRTASASSIDSVSYIETALGPTANKKPRRRAMKIRPGTPELPDSTDFVCGTLDEDRPMENAYISCMTARKNAKHKQTPQDIDPSFPTSDPEKSEDELDLIESARDSDDHVWFHGKFEESDNEGRHRSTRRKSPIVSPRRLHSPPPRKLHSPPPPKHRHRSPPPRKLFGHSPRRLRSPPPARAIQSPAASPEQGTIGAINFIPLASRPGLTHTKSLPRAPNMFGRQYKASRIVAATGLAFDSTDAPDGHVRGAIDIVKGLEQKRQRRKEKFLQKLCNRKKVQPERRPQPGKGAERMRELGLLMAGKTEVNDPYMMSA